jgi:predicted Zn-dependent peptidase
MRIILSIVFLFMLTGARAQLSADDVKTFTLRNGMKILVLEDHSIPNANMYIFYKVGSRNEHPGITGLSHFFEHMMFNGSKKYGPKMFDQTMEKNGGANNAYTSNDLTVYTNWFPSSAIETIFDLEADRISSLTIDSKMVESERGVVLSERSTGLENSPFRLLMENIFATAFQEAPYHWPVIGYEEDIKNWTKEDLEMYFKTYYAPNNAVMVISGDVTVDQVKKLAGKYLEPIPAQPAPKKIHLTEPPQTGERRFVVQKNIPTPVMGVGYHVPDARHGDYYALDLMQNIMASGNSSRLYSALVDKKQLLTFVNMRFGLSFDPSLLMIYGQLTQEADPKLLEEALFAELEKLTREGVTAAELEKAKNQKMMEFYSEFSNINGKSNTIGTYEVYLGDYRKLYDAPKEYSKVTNEDIKRVANQYLRKSNRTVGYVQSKVD